MLNPTELIDPKCKVCGNTPVIRDIDHLFLELRDIDHLFLELSLLNDKLVEYINNTSVAGSWSQNAIQATNAWLKEGLKKRCITRDLKWRVPVPHEKYKEKVFYVWFDAPIGYISITACYTPDWEKWWKDPNVELYQFMGKDNVPFHTIMIQNQQNHLRFSMRFYVALGVASSTMSAQDLASEHFEVSKLSVPS